MMTFLCSVQTLDADPDEAPGLIIRLIGGEAEVLWRDDLGEFVSRVSLAELRTA